MSAFKDLLNGHGLIAVGILLIATLFVILNKMPIENWETLAQWIAGIFTGGHAAISVGNSIATGKSDIISK